MKAKILYVQMGLSISNFQGECVEPEYMCAECVLRCFYLIN